MSAAVKINVYVGGPEGGQVVPTELRSRDTIRIPTEFNFATNRFDYVHYVRVNLAGGDSLWVLQELLKEEEALEQKEKRRIEERHTKREKDNRELRRMARVAGVQLVTWPNPGSGGL